MSSYLCPLHREFLTFNLAAAYRYVDKAQQTSEDFMEMEDYETAQVWSGHALETAQLILDLENGWSVHSIMQFTAASISFCRLAMLCKISSSDVMARCIQNLEAIIHSHKLNNVMYVKDCLNALKLQQGVQQHAMVH